MKSRNKVAVLKLVDAVLSVFLALVGGLMPAAEALAARPFDNMATCLSTSGHSLILSVNSYACPKAAVSSQNICATWLSAPGSSAITLIDAPAVTGTISVAFYGMCTDRADRTNRLFVSSDNGSITGFSANFNRSGNWGHPSSQTATLDVAKFIDGLSPTVDASGYYVYTRAILVWRSHSDAASISYDISIIRLRIAPAGAVVPPPAAPTDICDTWAPASYGASGEDHGVTTVEMKIRNLDERFGGTGYGDWNDGTIYAMPTDEIEWHTCYYPGVQTTADTEVSGVNEVKWEDSHPLSDSVCEADKSVDYQPLKEVATYWENHYDVIAVNHTPHINATAMGLGTGTAGDTTVQEATSSKNTGVDDVGKTITEKAQTWRPKEATISRSNPTKDVYKCPCCPDPPEKECEGEGEDEVCTEVPCTETNDCYCCTNKYADEIVNASVDYGRHDDSVSVQIPYNFSNYTGVNIDDGIVHSGENDLRLGNVWVLTTVRSNSVTLGTYATKVPKSQAKLFAYVTDAVDSFSPGYTRSTGNGCSEIGSSAAKQCLEMEDSGEITLNPDGDLDGDDNGDVDEINDWAGNVYNAFDAAAGDYICFVSAVYPAEPPSDTVVDAHDGSSDPSWGSANWRYSEPDCALVAKRPTFQVWGGSLFSAGNINANTTVKQNIYKSYRHSWNDLSGFHKTGSVSSPTNLTSWVEEDIVLTGGVTGSVASGAATGKDASLAAGAGSSKAFCSNRAPLSFANYGGGVSICNTVAAVGDSGINAGITDREKLIDYWVGSGGVANMGGGVIDLGYPSLYGEPKTSASGVGVRYVHASEDLTLYGTVPKATTYLIKSDAKVTISGDIRYDTSNYDALREVPKLIIYAANVDISCGVGEVDAIIITRSGGAVDTCYESGTDVNDAQRAKQLKIFGMVITDAVDLKRTYGNAANSGSMTDPSGMPSDGAAAEIFDYDSSILMWSEYMAGSAETDTIQSVYQHELAPRY